VRYPAAVAVAAFVAAAACAAPPSPDSNVSQTSVGQQADGERLFRQCYACHAIEPGRNTPAGPTLHALVGRPIAAEPGFN
jgi:cytochrome c